MSLQELGDGGWEMREKVNPSGLLTITQRALVGAGNTRKANGPLRA